MQKAYIGYTMLFMSMSLFGMSSHTDVSTDINMIIHAEKCLVFGKNTYKWQEEKVYPRSQFLLCYVLQCHQDEHGNRCEDICYTEGSEEVRYLRFVGNVWNDTGYLKSGTCVYYKKDGFVSGGDIFCSCDTCVDGCIPSTFRMTGLNGNVSYEEALNPHRVSDE